MVTRPSELTQRCLEESFFPWRMRTVAFRQVHGAHQLARPPRPIRGLLMDVCNILYDDSDWRRWLLRLLARLGLRAEYGPFFRIFDCDYLQAVYCGRQSFGDALNSFLISAGLSPGQAEEAGRALESHRRQSEASHRPLIGVRETLAQLDQSGIKLGVLCNSEHAGETIQRQLTEVLGSSPWSAVVSSRDLGSAMPQAECYAAALDAIRLPAAAAAFVGHDARELHGASHQGLTTISFNADPDARADVHLQRFEVLLDLAHFAPCGAVVA